ncbi:hypothetical protein ACH5RR_021513 [Cinchona calisaya]|uniref:Uncharacterized protein n=1 Tax=Cinchona calisaya TaxID=153742 RepID=A0ABD2ZHI4_9GENT
MTRWTTVILAEYWHYGLEDEQLGSNEEEDDEDEFEKNQSLKEMRLGHLGLAVRISHSAKIMLPTSFKCMFKMRIPIVASCGGTSCGHGNMVQRRIVM